MNNGDLLICRRCVPVLILKVESTEKEGNAALRCASELGSYHPLSWRLQKQWRSNDVLRMCPGSYSESRIKRKGRKCRYSCHFVAHSSYVTSHHPFKVTANNGDPNTSRSANWAHVASGNQLWQRWQVEAMGADPCVYVARAPSRYLSGMTGCLTMLFFLKAAPAKKVCANVCPVIGPLGAKDKLHSRHSNFGKFGLSGCEARRKMTARLRARQRMAHPLFRGSRAWCFMAAFSTLFATRNCCSWNVDWRRTRLSTEVSHLLGKGFGGCDRESAKGDKILPVIDGFRRERERENTIWKHGGYHIEKQNSFAWITRPKEKC